MNNTNKPKSPTVVLSVIRGHSDRQINSKPRANCNTGVTARDIRLMSKKVTAFIDATFSQYLLTQGRHADLKTRLAVKRAILRDLSGRC